MDGYAIGRQWGEGGRGMSTDLWGGEFGDLYQARNATAGEGRWPFWRDFYNRWPVASVLEVGCGGGANLVCAVPPDVAGVDVNAGAIIAAQARVPRATIVTGSATRLPFPDRSYELVFTCGLLIHIPPVDLPKAIYEMLRVSSKYALVMEYHAPHETMIEYRGKMNALWKRPYRALFEDRYALDHLDGGFLARPAFDDLHWDLWRKRP